MTLIRNRMIKIIVTPMKFFNNSSIESEKRISSTKEGAQEQENMIARHIVVQYFFVICYLVGQQTTIKCASGWPMVSKGPWWLSFCPWQWFLPKMLGGFSHLIWFWPVAVIFAKCWAVFDTLGIAWFPRLTLSHEVHTPSVNLETRLTCFTDNLW